MPTLQHLSMPEFIQPELLKAPRPKQTTPNLSLATIPISQNEAFEIWTPKWTVNGSRFMLSEIELIQRDRPRVTRILSKLVWLMGAICLSEEDWDVGDRQPIYDWDAVIEFVRREGRYINPIVTEVIFTPHALIPIYDKARKQEGKIPPQAWEVSPPHWSLVFDDLIRVGQGFGLKQAGDWLSVEIWTGKPIRRDVRNGKFYVEYRDFYASSRG